MHQQQRRQTYETHIGSRPASGSYSTTERETSFGEKYFLVCLVCLGGCFILPPLFGPILGLLLIGGAVFLGLYVVSGIYFWVLGLFGSPRTQAAFAPPPPPPSPTATAETGPSGGFNWWLLFLVLFVCALLVLKFGAFVGITMTVLATVLVMWAINTFRGS